jgi:hypothetical protein
VPRVCPALCGCQSQRQSPGKPVPVDAGAAGGKRYVGRDSAMHREVRNTTSYCEVVLFHDDPDCKDETDSSRRKEVLRYRGVVLANASISVKLDCSTHRRPTREIREPTDEPDIDIMAMAIHGTWSRPAPAGRISHRQCDAARQPRVTRMVV